MATYVHIPRSPQPVRAALMLLVCAILFAGCQSPWRAWRKNDPTMEELLVYPQPWDAEARLHEEDPRRADDGRARGSRANPYAVRSSAAAGKTRYSEQIAPGDIESGDETTADEFSDADAEEALAAAPPHLRPMLKRQWEATRAQANPPAQNARTSDARPAGARDASRAQPSAGGNSYRLSDDTDVLIDEAAESIDPQRSSQARGPRSQEPTDRSALQQRGQQQRGQQQRDRERLEEDQELAGAAAGIPNRKPLQPLEQLAPPPSKKTSRPVVHAEPLDTGFEDETETVALAVAARSVPVSTAVDSRDGKQNYVAPASAELTETAQASPVQPASVQSPSVQSASGQSAPAPPVTTKKNSWRDSARETLRLLEEESQQSSTSTPAQQLHTQALQRLLALTLGELEPALKPIDGLQPHEQEFFRHEIQALYNAIDPNGNPVLSRRWALVMDSQRQAMTHLAAVSNLEIKSAAFCSNVDGFGAITKFPNTQFRANQELLLYCEVDNFVSDPVKDGFETKLQGSYEIVDASGVRVADVLLPQELDVCRHLRRDYFFAYRIYMPQKIEPGRYQMRLTIEDMKGRKYGQSTLDFQIMP